MSVAFRNLLRVAPPPITLVRRSPASGDASGEPSQEPVVHPSYSEGQNVVTATVLDGDWRPDDRVAVILGSGKVVETVIRSIHKNKEIIASAAKGETVQLRLRPPVDVESNDIVVNRRDLTVATFCKHLRDTDTWVRQRAATALAVIAPGDRTEAKLPLDSLVRALDDTDPTVQDNACRALASLCGRNGFVAAHLRRLLRQTPPTVHKRVLSHIVRALMQCRTALSETLAFALHQPGENLPKGLRLWAANYDPVFVDRSASRNIRLVMTQALTTTTTACSRSIWLLERLNKQLSAPAFALSRVAAQATEQDSGLSFKAQALLARAVASEPAESRAAIAECYQRIEELEDSGQDTSQSLRQLRALQDAEVTAVQWAASQDTTEPEAVRNLLSDVAALLKQLPSR